MNWCNRDLHQELVSSKIKAKCQASDEYTTKLYSALCNVSWQPLDTVSILRDATWSCSWRTAGSIVYELRHASNNDAGYLDYYCAGNEGYIDPEIRHDLEELGWVPYNYQSPAKPS